MATQEWISQVEGIDQSTVEEYGPQYPFLQWVNGKAPEKRAGGVPFTGGWFVQQLQVGRETLEGWTRGTLIHRDGTETDGFFARDITVSLVHHRRRWLSGTNGDTRGFAWNDYDSAKAWGKATGHMHALVIVRGLEDLGPLVLTMKGSVSAAFIGSKAREGVIAAHSRLVVGQANSLTAKAGKKGRWPFRAFWLTVGPQRDATGAPVFSEVGVKPNTSQVTLPVALGLHDGMTGDEIGALFVGASLLEQLNQLYTETDAWAHAWDASTAPVSDEAVEPHAATAAKGEELPF
jgi:hypothetical protein